MTDAAWTAFPNVVGAKLWIGPGDSVRNALTLYNPSSWQGKVVKRVFRSLPERLARALLPRLHGEKAAPLDLLSAQLRELTGTTDSMISFYTGTPGPHRKTTAQITEDGRISLYAKIGDTKASRNLILREYENLILLKKFPHAPFSVPEATNCMDGDKQTIAAQTSPDYDNINTRDPNLLDADMDAFLWLSTVKPDRVALCKLLEAHEIMHMVAEMKSQGTACAETLSNAVAFLQKAFNSQEVQTGFAHGDYTPWNTLRHGETGLYIFDWEYARTDMPALFDLIHFMFMPARLVAGYSPATAITKVFEGLNSITGYHFVRVIAEQDLLTAHVTLYLLLLLARDFEPGSQPDDYLIHCIHVVLLKSADSLEPCRVLVSAYACDPNEGSEPGVGWNMVTAIASQHEAWVITRSNNRTAIEEKLATAPQPRLHFIYVDLPHWAAFWKKGGRGIRTYYYLWQLFAWYRANQLLKERDFDLAHHVTFVNDWLYSFTPLIRLPAVWGPIGSHPYIPFSLRMDFSAFVRDRLRYIFQAFMRFIDPLFWICAFRSTLIVGIEKSVIRRMPPIPGIKDRFIAHTAIGVESLPPPRTDTMRQTPGLRVLSVGRLVTIKGFHVTLMAFADLVRHHPDSSLTIIGKGPLKSRLIRLTHELSISEAVKFVDWLPRSEVITAMREADVFLFPSFEGGGMVVLEAMANQVPVVCLDYGGPGQMVGDECGYKVTPASMATTVTRLGEALRNYAREPATLKQHGKNARLHVETHYLWSNRTVTIDTWYWQAIGSQRSSSRSRPG